MMSERVGMRGVEEKMEERREFERWSEGRDLEREEGMEDDDGGWVAAAERERMNEE